MAGLRLGWSLLAPGQWSRVEALRRGALSAIPLVYGSMAMLLAAAAIEAFWSSSTNLPRDVKIGVGIAGWVILTVYFLAAGRGRGEARACGRPSWLHGPRCQMTHIDGAVSGCALSCSRALRSFPGCIGAAGAIWAPDGHASKNVDAGAPWVR